MSTFHPSYGEVPIEVVKEAMAAPWGQAEGIIERYKKKLREEQKLEKKNQTLRQQIADIRIKPRRKQNGA